MLLWDGECGFCRRSVDRLRHQLGSELETVPYQDGADRFPDIDRAKMMRAAQLVDTDGRVYAGAHAILRAGGMRPGLHPVLWAYEKVPPFRWVADRVYRWIADHRAWVASASSTLLGPDLLPRQYRLTRWVILRLLGLTALCAFASLLVQIDGLMGEQGIAPAAAKLGRWADADLSDRLLGAPTLAWIDASSGTLELFAILGIVLSVMLIVDVAPPLAVLGIWLLYLSLVSVGSPFLPFQWDTLLLEAMFAALFLVPWRLRPRLQSDREPTAAGIWLFRLLIFKVMILSGLVKIFANDPVWADGSALDYHFFTQPIPIWSSYYMHHAPDLMREIGLVLMAVAELGLPWLVFAPRKLRLWFFAGTVGLMVLIGATGNYGFFNLLTVAIAFSLVDDAFLRRVVPRRWRDRVPDPAEPPRRPPLWSRRIAVALAVPVVALGACHAKLRLDRDWDPPGPVKTVLQKTWRLHLSGAYGLFADMTTERPEIVVEGSRDGRTWQPYVFEYKVQDLDEVPDFAGPHMPRLDWQMWFAALGSCRQSPWFHAFVQRLLEGSPAVRGLLAEDPFGDEPPRYVRSFRYLYVFAGDDRLGGEQDGVEEGDWWRRALVDRFCPVATLQGGQLRWIQRAR